MKAYINITKADAVIKRVTNVGSDRKARLSFLPLSRFFDLIPETMKEKRILLYMQKINIKGVAPQGKKEICKIPSDARPENMHALMRHQRQILMMVRSNVSVGTIKKPDP